MTLLGAEHHDIVGGEVESRSCYDPVVLRADDLEVPEIIDGMRAPAGLARFQADALGLIFTVFLDHRIPLLFHCDDVGQ